MARLTRKQAGEKTILIVDDNEEVREAMSATLSRDGFKVLTASNITAAKRLLPGIDLIMLDVRLDRENGIGELEKLRRDGFDRPALLMSGMASAQENIRAFELTGYPVLTKPVSVEELVEIIGKLKIVPG